MVGESKLDVNSAALAEFAAVLGLSRALAKEIVIKRAKSPLKTLDELLELKGIGPRALDKLRRHLVVLPPRKEAGNA